MAEVSFYLLSSESLQERYLYACRLIEKAYRSGHFCYVLTDTSKHSQHLDDLLWTFRAGSFIPHQLYTGEVPDLQEVVLIGSLDAPEHWQKTIINLSSKCPANFKLAERILEILNNDQQTRELGRNRYRYYQQADFPITTHKIDHAAS